MEKDTRRSHSHKPSIKEIKTRFNNVVSSLFQLLSTITSKTERGAWRANTQKRNPEELRQFRFEDYESYQGLKRNIIDTFNAPDSKLYK